MQPALMRVLHKMEHELYNLIKEYIPEANFNSLIVSVPSKGELVSVWSFRTFSLEVNNNKNNIFKGINSCSLWNVSFSNTVNIIVGKGETLADNKVSFNALTQFYKVNT